MYNDSGRFGMFRASHIMAIQSERRSRADVGKAFTLRDARIWMRLHFWAVRECQLDKHELFYNWYVKFIGTIIQVFNEEAADFVLVDASWSSDLLNTQLYKQLGTELYTQLRNQLYNQLDTQLSDELNKYTKR